MDSRRWRWRRSVFRVLLTVLLAGSMGLVAPAARAADRPDAVYGSGKARLTLATGSPGALGLLKALALPFCKTNDCRIFWYKKGSGAALAFLKAGRCDVVMVHAPAAEKAAVAAGWAVDRTLVGANRFFIVGPKSDPAGISRARTAPEAYSFIARSRALFYSRGDNSGTHKRELTIWQLAGIRPGGDWYRTSHAFMGPTLMLADRYRAYFMTDNSTYYVKQAKLKNLVPLFVNDPILVNVYHVLRPDPGQYPTRSNTLARRFIEFLASSKGQNIIRNYGRRQYGRPLYQDAAVAVRLVEE